MADQKLTKPVTNTTGKAKKGSEVVPPFYNMGVKVSATGDASEFKYPRKLDNVKIIKTEDGDKPVLHSVPVDREVSALDWVSYAYGLDTYHTKYLFIPNEDKDQVYDELALNDISQDLFDLYGFGVKARRKSGMHHCTHSYDLDDNMGVLLMGHSSNKIYIQINGSGCALAAKGWQERLYRYLTEYATRSSLTRVDLCVDDFEPENDIVWWDEQESLGAFWTGGRMPKVQHYGSWKRPDGSGRTLMVGRRENGKCLRIYERGKKEGDCLSPWLRYEVEFKSVDRFIPFDILLAPTQYFVGAYPALMSFRDHHQPEKITTFQKAAKINWERSKDIVKHQFGGYIAAYRQIYSDSEIIEFITKKDLKKFPKRLKMVESLALKEARDEQLRLSHGYVRLQTAVMTSTHC